MELNVTRYGVTVLALTEELPQAIVDALILHGFQSRVGDAAANVGSDCAKDALGAERFDKLDAAGKKLAVKTFTMDPANALQLKAAAEGAMGKVVDALRAGDWGTKRRAVSGMTQAEAEFLAWLRYAKIIQGVEGKVADWKTKTTAERLQGYIYFLCFEI